MAGKDVRATQRDAAHRTLTALEKRVQEVVQAALDRVADEFARQALHAREALNANDLTAQSGDPIDPLDLSRITILWDNELPTIVTALGVVYDEAAGATFARFGATDTARARLAQAYLDQAENRLREVGDTLWEAARTTLQEGSLEGLGVDELRRRLQETFAENGVELGETRAETIARTETVGAWNRATDDAVHVIPEEERPTHKAWLATLDARTRSSHAQVDGVVVPIDQTFTVGGVPMDRPGDPNGPPEEVINCRCLPGDVRVSAEVSVAMRRRFEGHLIRITTASGRELSATSEHPVLTRCGWVEAGLIHPGDEMIRTRTVVEDACLGGIGRPDIRNVEPPIHEVYDALAFPTERAERATTRAVYFEGEGTHGKVDVQMVDQQFPVGVDTSFLQRLSEFGITAPQGEVGLTSDTTPSCYRRETDLVGLGTGPNGQAQVIERSGDDAAVHVESFGHLQHGQSSGVEVSNFDRALRTSAATKRAAGLIMAANGGTEASEIGMGPRQGSTERVGTFLDAVAGQVELDEAVLVERLPFSGHVYDLSTPQRAFTANEFIVHNCVLTYGYDGSPVDDDGRQFLSDDQIQRVLNEWEDRGIVRDIDNVTAAGGHTLAMIALVPSDADLDRLALPGGEPIDELHVTLAFLGDAQPWSSEQRDHLVTVLHAMVANRPVAEGAAFGVNHWNPHGEDPCFVYAVGGADLDDIHHAVWRAMWDADHEDGGPGVPEVPEQHRPWAAHLTGAYSTDSAMLAAMVNRLGPVTFDRLRLAIGDQVTDIPLGTHDTTSDATPRYTQIRRWQRGPGTRTEGAPMTGPTITADAATNRSWSTPGERAIAFEDTETGDGRIFAPNALYWENEGNGWPFRGNENLDTHDDAALIGSIDEMGRIGRRIPARGVLYSNEPIGAKVIGLLEAKAPLGVSVDLDDVSFEVRYRGAETEDDDGGIIIIASAASMRVLTGNDGQHTITASGVMWGTEHPSPQIPVALSENGMFTASAGDTDSEDGEIIFQQHSGDEIMRVTRARVRGATVVSLPAYSPASIALDDAQGIPSLDRDQLAASGQLSDLMLEIIDYVQAAPEPVRPGQVANAVGVDASKARTYLVRAVDANRLRRVGRGLYSCGPEVAEVTAAVVGDPDLPIHDDPDRTWDGDEAASRVLEWAQADEDNPPSVRLSQAFLYRDDDANPNAVGSYSLGFADVFDGNLRIVRSGVHATAGGRGVDQADIPEDQKERIRSRICGLYERLADTFEQDEGVVCPWDREDDTEASAFLPAEIEASAWTQFQAMPAMPAEWFAEPTLEELPPDSGGVHLADGRIYGWVVQHGVPHDGFSKTLTLEHLLSKGDIDTTHFLRRKRELDDGTFVNVGAFTMNVGHHRDGGECETAACQFDDTRTVAGIVTVGINDRGMWFSGAAAPWLSTWDLEVFATCQPSYRVRQLRDGRYSLRAVLSVPMPGHPSALAASAEDGDRDGGVELHATCQHVADVVDRSNIALGHASTITAGVLDATEIDVTGFAVAVVDEMERRQAARDELAALAADVAPIAAELEVAALAADVNETQPSTGGDS